MQGFGGYEMFYIDFFRSWVGGYVGGEVVVEFFLRGRIAGFLAYCAPEILGESFLDVRGKFLGSSARRV